MAIPTYGLLGAGSAMLQAPPGQGIGQTLGQGLSGFIAGMPADMATAQTAQRRKTLSDVRQAWLSGAKSLAENHPTLISYLSNVSKAESGDRNIPQGINATGSAFGPFQFTEGTWRDQIARHPELGLTEQDRFNPAAQGRVAVTFTRDNQAALRGALNRTPTPGELLLAHRFGAQGAISLLNTPRGSSVAAALPDAVKANPQWSNMTVSQILDQTNRAAGQASSTQGGGGLLGSSPTPTPGSSTDGLAALFGGMPLAPMGTALENMTPEFRNILSIALQDPSLGPMALQTILQAGLSGGAGKAGSAIKPTDEVINAIAAGYRPGTPEWDRVVGKAPQPETLKPDDIMKEAQALYPDNPAAQRQFIEDYRRKPAAAVTVQNIPQALPVNKAVADKFEGDIGAGDAARAAIGRIEAAKMALQQINTGAGAGLVANVGSYLRSAGVDPSIFGIPDTASPAEAINAITAPMILELRGTGKGGEGGMPGNLSDNDLKFLRSSTIGIEKQPGANQAILMVQERLQQRRLELEQLAADHAQTNNGQVAGSYINERLNYIKSHPLFDDAFKKEFKAALTAPGVSAMQPPAAPASTITPVAPNTPTSPGGAAPPPGPPTINDQKAYDALPSGTTYQSGGKLYRKP